MGAVTLFRPVLIALAALTGSAQAQLLPAVQDLSYGESLYHYYQGDLLQALTTLEIAQSRRGGIEGHRHYPELMRAGMLLAFGMTEQAQQVFADHLGQGEPAVVQDTARLYLARLHYQMGRFDEARTNLAALQGALPAELAEEAATLNVNLYIAEHGAPSLDKARQLLEPLGESPHLALLNLGHSAARAQDPVRAQRYYRTLLESPPPSDPERSSEYLAIRDKALTALGYSYLQQKDYASAKDAFRQIRLDTALANLALLGYGWSAASYHDFVLALKPWQALSKRSLLDPAVQESLIAVPWAYEQMGSAGAALIAYSESEQLLTDKLAELDQYLQTLSPQSVLNYLSGDTPPAALSHRQNTLHQHWLNLAGTSVITSQLTYFDELLREDEVQQQAQALRDLLDIQRRHRHWQHQLSLYTELVEQKRARRAERAESLLQSQLLSQYQQLQRQRDQLAEQLRQIDARNDVLALADKPTRALYTRLQSARRALQALDGKQPLPYQAREKLHFFAGVLTWQAAQNFPAQRWQVQKRLNQIQHILAQSQAASGRIEQLLTREQDLQSQFDRLAAAAERNNQLLVQLDSEIDERAAQLSGLLQRHLTTHRMRLNDYLAQTRLSIARLMDDAYRNRPSPDGLQLPEVEAP